MRDLNSIIERLPSGSGFNSEWEWKSTLKNGKEIIETYFHNMHENGYYDGLTKIRLKVDLNDPLDFVMTCTGRPQYIETSREYWADTIHYSLLEEDEE